MENIECYILGECEKEANFYKNDDLLDVKQMFIILDKNEGYPNRTEEDMLQVINKFLSSDKVTFPNFLCAVNIKSPHKNEELSHKGNKIFVLRNEFYELCDEIDYNYN